jgi:hypothetical protein
MCHVRTYVCMIYMEMVDECVCIISLVYRIDIRICHCSARTGNGVVVFCLINRSPNIHPSLFSIVFSASVAVFQTDSYPIEMASRTSAVSLAHEEDTDPHAVTTFISKVWKIVEKPEYNHLISWSTVSR